MAKLVYFDTSVVRKLIENPNNWNILHDSLHNEIGPDIRPMWSYYLFFEYLGVTKKHLNIKNDYSFNEELPFKLTNKKKLTIELAVELDVELEKMGVMLDEEFEKIRSDIKNIFADPATKALIDKKIEERKSLSKLTFEGSQDLFNILFGYILNLFYMDYERFSQEAAMFLAWDCFSNISWSGISEERLRKAQLGTWWRLSQEKNCLLPFGKIIDNLAKQNNVTLSDNSPFKGPEDMVDAEAMTDIIMGLTDSKGRTEPVNFITGDNPINIQERKNLGEAIIIMLEKDLDITIPRNFGKVYCFNVDNENFRFNKLV